MTVTDKKIGVLFGGLSAERDVSLRTGKAILDALLGLGYNAKGIDAGRNIAQTLARESIDVAFIALHGGVGEDGSIQGLLEVLGIPYTGSGVLASALAMDKEFSKKMFIQHGLMVPDYVVVGKEDKEPSIGFPLPWVVKPSTEGSSIGVTMVSSPEGLALALQSAFDFGPRAIVERRLRGREIQVGVLGNRPLGAVEVRPKLDFYSYEAKYTPGMTEYILPPEMEKEKLEAIHETGLRAHQALGCRGATRVDLIVTDDGACYVLEVNTIPGMTETSLLPKIARLSGIEFPALVDEILKEAIR